MRILICIFILSVISCNTSSSNESSSNIGSSNESSSDERTSNENSSYGEEEKSSTTENKTESKKCFDMDSYDFGYAVARDQDGLLADCDYLYEIASTQREIGSKSCFCEGVSDYRNNK